MCSTQLLYRAPSNAAGLLCCGSSTQPPMAYPLPAAGASFTTQPAPGMGPAMTLPFPSTAIQPPRSGGPAGCDGHQPHSIQDFDYDGGFLEPTPTPTTAPSYQVSAYLSLTSTCPSLKTWMVLSVRVMWAAGTDSPGHTFTLLMFLSFSIGVTGCACPCWALPPLFPARSSGPQVSLLCLHLELPGHPMLHMVRPSTPPASATHRSSLVGSVHGTTGHLISQASQFGSIPSLSCHYFSKAFNFSLHTHPPMLLTPPKTSWPLCFCPCLHVDPIPPTA